METPAPTGTVHPGFEPVREVFAELLRSGAETGAGLAVYRDGRLLVDLIGGWTTTTRSASWSRDTLVHTYSVSKPFAALAALTLVAAGRLDLDAPLASVWPSYAANGKSGTTLRDALSHRAAQPAFPDGLRTQDLYDAPLLEAALASAPPEWDPGTAPAEHALTYGHVLSGVVRAVTARELVTFSGTQWPGRLGRTPTSACRQPKWSAAPIWSCRHPPGRGQRRGLPARCAGEP